MEPEKRRLVPCAETPFREPRLGVLTSDLVTKMIFQELNTELGYRTIYIANGEKAVRLNFLGTTLEPVSDIP